MLELKTALATKNTGKRSCLTEKTATFSSETFPVFFVMFFDAGQSLLRTAMKQLHLTARAFHRVLKLSRTIADLEDRDVIKAHHIAEALQYRYKEII